MKSLHQFLGTDDEPTAVTRDGSEEEDGDKPFNWVIASICVVVGAAGMICLLFYSILR